MTKGNFHGNFDPETYQQFQDLVGKGNVTNNFEDYMMRTIATEKADITGIDIQLLNIEIGRLTKRLTKIQAEIKAKIALKEQYEQNGKEKEEEVLKQEKERLESSQTCDNCKRIIPEIMKIHKFAKGQICQACYGSLPAADLKGWI